MIELLDDMLWFRCPEVHPQAAFEIGFQRTLRIPDDGRDYPLPAGLGLFTVDHVDDHADRVPASWLERGGVMLPMYQAEALWISFSASAYPFAVKVAAGTVNAVSGGPWSMGLSFGVSPSDDRGEDAPEGVQDYVVVPEQPWLDGFNVGHGRIRQFVAMPLGSGYTAEEQVTGQARFGGLQLLAYPMRAEAFERLERRRETAPMSLVAPAGMVFAAGPADMGLGLGGLMRQDIEADPFDPEVWDLDHPSRCFVHLANAELWPELTGRPAPGQPPTPEEYRRAGIPWFDFGQAGPKVPGSDVLAGLDPVAQVAAERGEELVDNESVPVDRVVHLRKSGPEVRPFGDDALN